MLVRFAPWKMFLCHYSSTGLKIFGSQRVSSVLVRFKLHWYLWSGPCLHHMLVCLVPQCLQSFLMDGFSCYFCILIKRISDATFQMFDPKPSNGRDGNHVSEGHVALRYHVIGQQIRELCRKNNRMLKIQHNKSPEWTVVLSTSHSWHQLLWFFVCIILHCHVLLLPLISTVTCFPIFI